ncbi:hypothetical protein L596_025377 [Steinernema carpocapsae]|uniref:Uncharacterized protein n=1 Tax=Steinernema carpocapsae TaxID=34508 RepID=A0A4U5M7S3_STECR|nr:hypothetical protein L596_025377 [Steinernema carpocapsae]
MVSSSTGVIGVPRSETLGPVAVGRFWRLGKRQSEEKDENEDKNDRAHRGLLNKSGLVSLGFISQAEHSIDVQKAAL